MIDTLVKENKKEPVHRGDIIYFVEDDSLFEVVNDETSYIYIEYYKESRLHWNKNVFLNPGSLNYWFDFLDTEGELSQYSVKAIGARTKAINENTVKSIYFREIP